MKYIFFFFVLIMANAVQAQYILTGSVTDGKNSQTIAGATVYINNSTIRTSTDKAGRYLLKLPTEGNYELVVSVVGYKLYVKEIYINSTAKHNIVLQNKTIEIEEVAISAFDKPGWKRWGKYFTETFIGTTAFSKQTKILNPEVLHFRYDYAQKALVISANEPLKISNHALGYDITYDLHTYRMDFGTRYLYFEGFASFQEKRHISYTMRKNRKEAYRSSMMRFIRSTYTDSWNKDGYRVRKLTYVQNKEYVWADSLLKGINRQVMDNFQGSWASYYASNPECNVDSVNYLRKILSQPAKFHILGKQLSPEEITSLSAISGQKKLLYENCLYIQNQDIIYEKEYFKWDKEADKSSLLTLRPQSSVWIDALGNYSLPTDWIVEGYWGWYGKVSTMLPLEYGLPLPQSEHRKKSRTLSPFSNIDRH